MPASPTEPSQKEPNTVHKYTGAVTLGNEEDVPSANKVSESVRYNDVYSMPTYTDDGPSEPHLGTHPFVIEDTS